MRHKRPEVSPGAHLYASMDAIDGSRWSVRLCLAGQEPGPWCKRMSPPFDLQMTAWNWLAWANGEVDAFEYPAGVA